jgi:hypothetical protein
VIGQIDPDTLVPPTDLTGNVASGIAHLTWTAPANADNLLRYDVERQGVVVGQTVSLETTYADTLTTLPAGNYTYRVRARYSSGVSPYCAPWNYYWDPASGISWGGSGYQPDHDVLAAFPNPTNGMLVVNLPTQMMRTNLVLALFDIAGREIKRWRAAGGNGTTINVPLPEGLGAGVYVLQIWFGESVQKRLKVVYLP